MSNISKEGRRTKRKHTRIFSKLTVLTISQRLHIISFIIILLLGNCIHGRRVSQYSPTNYLVIGDRFSGADYLNDVLKEIDGFPLKECPSLLPSSDSSKWKHGFFSFLDLRQNLNCDLEKTLFIMVTRNPFAWLLSVANRKFEKVTPYHVLALVSNRFEDNLGLNSGPGKVRPTTIFKLRTKKLKSQHSIIKKARHGVVIRYVRNLCSTIVACTKVYLTFLCFELRYEDLLPQNTEKVIKNALRGKGLAIGPFNVTSNLLVDKHRNSDAFLDNEGDSIRIFFEQRTIDRALKKLDKNLEVKIFGYEIPPNELFPSSMASRNWYKRIYRACVDILWWVIVPTVVLMLTSTVLILSRDLKKYGLAYIYSLRGMENKTPIDVNDVGAVNESRYQHGHNGRLAQWKKRQKLQ